MTPADLIIIVLLVFISINEHIGRKRIMADLTVLIAQVQATTDAETAAVQCIQGLAKELEAAKGNQAAIDDVVAKMKASADALGAAIVANTVPAPAPTPEEQPTG